jgi:hypothetical protein
VTAERIAFVGDVHGNLNALNGIIPLTERAGVDRFVFLGDYINKGPSSAEVIQTLLERSTSHLTTLLRGNHETAMLAALDTGILAEFLKIGGASTIRSYVKRPVASDVLGDFRSCLPPEHIDFLRSMHSRFETQDVIASHHTVENDTSRYRVSAHVPVGERPVVDAESALIDTGCGVSTGRLTAFLWPARTYVQVDSTGRLVESDNNRANLGSRA